MLQEVLTKIRKANPTILVIGETILDEWYFGEYTRPCQEDKDVQVFDRSTEDMQFTQGGAAGVHHNLKELVLSPRISHWSNPADETSTKTRYRDQKTGRIVFRSDHDRVCDPLSPGRIPFCDCVVISDYGKGLLPWDYLCFLAEKFPEKRFIFSPHVSSCRTCDGHIMRKLEKWVWVLNHEEDAALPLSVLHLDLMAVVTHGSEPIGYAYPSMHEGAPNCIQYMNLSHRVNLPHSCAVGDVFLAAFSAAFFSLYPLDRSITFAKDCCHQVLSAKRKGSCRIESEDLK